MVEFDDLFIAGLIYYIYMININTFVSELMLQSIYGLLMSQDLLVLHLK